MHLRRIVVRVVAVLFSLLLFLLTGEVALRLSYRDAGRRTLGGPGGRHFEHLTIGTELRGRRDVGPRRPGVPRLMVIGDSITYGQGVRDWRDTWPEQLALMLERQGRPHEMAVFGMPGRNMAEHLEEIHQWGDRVAADVVIYQWYVNDLEVAPERPDFTRQWQRWRSHEWLRRNSYLYFFLDHRASQLLPPPDRSYVDYMLQNYVPGSAEWSEFERRFHSFAMTARATARRHLMLLYPQVPYRGSYPLQSIHDRMRAMARGHWLSIPPMAWVRSAGQITPDASAPWKHALHVPRGVSGSGINTYDYFFLPGTLDIELTISAEGRANGDAAIATVEVVDVVSNEQVATSPVSVGGGLVRFKSIPLRLTVPGPRGRRLQFRVLSTGEAGWALAEVRIAVDYGIEVVDLTEPLNRFNTHASVFDAHPNEAAQRVIAEHALRALTHR